MQYPTSMRATRIVAYGGPSVIETVGVDVPPFGPHEVLVQSGAAAVDNTDLWTRESAYGLPGDPGALGSRWTRSRKRKNVWPSGRTSG